MVCVCHSVMPNSVIPCTGETDGLQYFFRQKYWVGLPFPFPGDLCNPGIEPRSLALRADSLLAEPSGKYLTHLSIPAFINPSFVMQFKVADNSIFHV